MERVTLAGLLLLYSAVYFASPSRDTELYSVDISLGYLRGESNEYVYNDDGSKLSQLNWKIQGSPMIQGRFSYAIRPWLTANLNGWLTFDKSPALMDDYDWLYPNQSHWSNWSHHVNTDLNDANAVALNVQGWILQRQHDQFGLSVGYERHTFRFQAQGGCYQYDNGEFTGCFQSNRPVIGYQQVFNTAYIGLVGNYTIQAFELNTALKYGPWVQANDIDEHYLRNLTFYENGHQSHFYSAALMAGFYIAPQTKIFLAAEYNRFTNGKADTHVLENDTGLSGYSAGTAGLCNHSYVLSLGMHYRL